MVFECFCYALVMFFLGFLGFPSVQSLQVPISRRGLLDRKAAQNRAQRPRSAGHFWDDAIPFKYPGLVNIYITNN